MYYTVICGILVVLGTCNNVRAQVASLGACKKVETQPNFSPSEYLGLWYEYERYPFVFEFASRCNQAVYGLINDTTISVKNDEISTITNEPVSIAGKGQYLGDAKFIVSFFNVPSFSMDPNYIVVSTDYVNYAVIYSCKSILGLFNGEVAWILTRQRFPSNEVISQAREVFTRNGISLTPLRTTDQSNCPDSF